MPASAMRSRFSRVRANPTVPLAEAVAMVRGRSEALQSELRRLLESAPLRFDQNLRSALPIAPGIYRIFNPTEPTETVRAGRTTTAASGLRQRVYQNHFMGTQKGNLRAQLVRDGVCDTMEAAKQYLRDRLVVQVLVVEDPCQRMRLEHYMLALLEPRYCDEVSSPAR